MEETKVEETKIEETVIEEVAQENKKAAKNAKEAKAPEVKPAEPRTACWLVSKANYIVPVKCNGQNLFIQPFGRVKVIRELTTFDRAEARYLTFVKA